MIVRISFFLIGFGFSIIGFTFIITYLNLIPFGYNFFEYVNFISKRIECLIGPLGLLIVFLSIFYKGDDSGNELHL